MCVCVCVCVILTNGADLLPYLIRHGLIEVLQLHTQTKVPQFDRVIREKDIGTYTIISTCTCMGIEVMSLL